MGGLRARPQQPPLLQRLKKKIHVSALLPLSPPPPPPRPPPPSPPSLSFSCFFSVLSHVCCDIKSSRPSTFLFLSNRPSTHSSQLPKLRLVRLYCLTSQNKPAITRKININRKQNNKKNTIIPHFVPFFLSFLLFPCGARCSVHLGKKKSKKSKPSRAIRQGQPNPTKKSRCYRVRVYICVCVRRRWWAWQSVLLTG